MELFVNKLKEPINIDVNPVFGWTLMQRTLSESVPGKVYSGDETVWTVVKLERQFRLYVEYEGNKLKSNSEYRVEVTVWDTKGNEYKGETRFESALLYPSPIWHGTGLAWRQIYFAGHSN